MKAFHKEPIDPGAKDLSKGKQTHMSTSLHGQVEFHLENKEIPKPKDFKEKGKYWISFPAEGSSWDDKGHRYKTEGLPIVHPRAEKNPEAKQSESKKSKRHTQVYKGGY